MDGFAENALLIELTFIYGGGSFELNPPRVSTYCGQFLEGLLSSSPIRTVERVLSPGIIKLALGPPVPVEDVARAAVAGALGKTESILDTYDKIKKASQALQDCYSSVGKPKSKKTTPGCDFLPKRNVSLFVTRLRVFRKVEDLKEHNIMLL